MLPVRRTRPVAGGENTRKTKPGTITAAKGPGTTAGKRQGDMLQDPSQKRRAAFGDITNALNDKANIRIALKKSKLPTTQLLKPAEKPSKDGSKASKRKEQTKKASSSENLTEESTLSLVSSQDSNSSSSGSSSSQESLVSAADLSCQGVENLVQVEDLTQEQTKPADVDDVDTENLGDPVQVALYAFDIFKYYKERETQFTIDNYMSTQKHLTSSMRAILVDWLVEVQENFELNHETLYLAVKLVDMYVSRVHTPKEALQLVGAVALFIAAKFDERCPPLVEDFLYICDDAYKRKEFLDMERCLLKAIGFDIGMPLSYRFLRRYAKCARSSMETLTLGRYILEMSLMEYDFIQRRDSEMAAASLLLALRMKNCGEWTKTMVYYTGYEESELLPLAQRLNSYIRNPPKQLTTIRSKYSHKVFYEVAKIPPLSDSQLV